MNNRVYNGIHGYNAIIIASLTYWILHEAKLVTSNKVISKLYNPVRISLIISLVTGLVFVGKRGLFDYSFTQFWITSIVTIPITLYIVSVILKINQVKELRSKILIYSLSFLFVLPTTFCPAISGALLIVLLCFMVNYRLGLSIGVISFIYFVSQYYYDINLTLLAKSVVLFTSGIIFLFFFFITYKKLGSNEEV
jgi:uncharacterized membrane protein